MTINRNDNSTSISTQMDSLVPASKISNLTQGMFVGAVSDNFDERIKQKIFHAEIVVDSVKVSAEMKAYQQIPTIADFTNQDGSDNLKKAIEANYKSIKQEVLSLVDSEIERIKNNPQLSSLIKKRVAINITAQNLRASYEEDCLKNVLFENPQSDFLSTLWTLLENGRELLVFPRYRE